MINFNISLRNDVPTENVVRISVPSFQRLETPGIILSCGSRSRALSLPRCHLMWRGYANIVQRCRFFSSKTRKQEMWYKEREHRISENRCNVTTVSSYTELKQISMHSLSELCSLSEKETFGFSRWSRLTAQWDQPNLKIKNIFFRVGLSAKQCAQRVLQIRNPATLAKSGSRLA